MQACIGARAQRQGDRARLHPTRPAGPHFGFGFRVSGLGFIRTPPSAGRGLELGIQVFGVYGFRVWALRLSLLAPNSTARGSSLGSNT